MFVCVCRKVSDKAISRAITEGARTYEDLQVDLGLGIQCGGCEPCARGLLDNALTEMGFLALSDLHAHAPDLHGLDCAACEPHPDSARCAVPAPGQLNLVAWAKPAASQHPARAPSTPTAAADAQPPSAASESSAVRRSMAA